MSWDNFDKKKIMKAITFLIAFATFIVVGCKKEESINDMYPNNDPLVEDTLTTDIGIEPIDTMDMRESVDTANIITDTALYTNP